MGLFWLKILWRNKKYFLGELRGWNRCFLFFGLSLKKGVMKGYVSDKI